MKTSGKIRFWSLALGILTAGTIVFSQFFYFDYQASGREVSVEHHDSTSGHDTSSDQEEGGQYINQPSFSQPVTSSFVLQQELAVIHEILFGDHEPEETPVQLTLSTGKLFRALFQFIISPNAP
ncbi:MAG: hypothetical protein KF803_16815 [Cyclobacteriaceae bacterium]|nr:hypothetical protein [Cyclobacteriaceae bacterium]